MTMTNVDGPELDLSDEDVAGLFAVGNYLRVRKKVADKIDELLINAIEEPGPEIDISALTESIIALFEERFPLKPRGLKEIVIS